MTHSAEDPLANIGDHTGSEPKEILVVTEHVGIVLYALGQLGISAPGQQDREDSVLLGLTRLKLVGDLATPEVAEHQSGPPTGAASADRIGPLLTAIKSVIQQGRRSGWVPTMGRNRLVGHVTGTDGGPIVSEVGASGVNPIHVLETEIPKQNWSRFDDEDGIGGQPTLKYRLDKPIGARVGIVDTALRPHPWLVGARVLPQAVGLPQSTAPGSWRAAHGTAMVGIVLQKAPDVEIDIEGALDKDGRTTVWNAANSIASFALSGIDILNLSFSCYTGDGLPPLALATAIDRLDPRIVVVAAAGNFGEAQEGDLDLSTAPAWPAALDDVVAVGSVTPGGSGWVTADFSPRAPWVDVLARGANVRSLIIANASGTNLGPAELPAAPGYAEWGGTSVSTAIVTGAIATQMQDARLSAVDAWHSLRDGLDKLGTGDPFYDPRLLPPDPGSGL
ncbi:MAG TPA: S8/S53 family peptidase [Nakamurella sp.]